MKYLIVLLALAFCFLSIESDAQGPSNADVYNYIVFSSGYDFRPDDNGPTINYPTFRMKALEDGIVSDPKFLLDQIGTQATHTRYWDEDTPSRREFGYRQLLFKKETSITNYDFETVAFDNNCSTRFTWQSCDGPIFNLFGTNPGVQGRTGEYSTLWKHGTGISMQFHTTWRHAYGVFPEVPLMFDTLSGTTTRTHTNYNSRVVNGAPNHSDLGYLNNWATDPGHPNLDNAPDVTYSFTIDTVSIIDINTNYTLTTYDSKLHITQGSRLNPSFIISNSAEDETTNKARISTVLDAGTYFIVVEGDNNAHGRFHLTLDHTPGPIDGGSISHPGTWVQDGCAITHDIISDLSATPDVGTYFWEKKSSDSTDWILIEGATSASLSKDEIGIINTQNENEELQVRRGYTSLNVTRYSNILSFETIEDGTAGSRGRISGKITGKNGNGEVANVSVYAVADPPVIGGCTNQVYEATSIGNGEYVIPNIYYGRDTTSWKIYPKFLDHQFDPDTFYLDLFQAVHERGNINFQDTTTIFINGSVIQADLNSINQDTCGIPDLSMFLNDVNQLPKVTNMDGDYQIAISIRDPNDQYIVRPDSTNYDFLPVQTPTFELLQDTSGVDFINTRKEKISGFVQACGNFYFGKVDIKIADLNGGCFEYIVATDETGYYEVTVPSRAYEISVVGVDVPSLKPGYTSGAILDYFSEVMDTIDITDGSATSDFVYRQAPVIEIEGLPLMCSDTVFTQGESTLLTIFITEENTDGCRLDTGVIIINDGISEREIVELPFKNGVVEYTLIPGEADIFSPYTKNFNITVKDIEDKYSTSVNFNAIVEGNKPRQATFTTVSPEVPMLILRDPPGDQSYSFVEESQTIELASSFSFQRGGGATIWREAKVGAQFEAGFLGFSTESQAWGSASEDLSISTRNSTSSEQIMSITNTIRYETNSDDEVIGKDADMFVAGALNLRYALTDIIEYNPQTCSIEESVDLIMGADSVNTLSVYTRNNIVTNVIPDLEVLRDLQSDPDSTRYYQNQIDAWQQMIDRNEDLKDDAFPDPSIPNISWDGADGAITKTTRHSSQSSYFNEFQLEIERGAAIEAGFEVAGSGVSGGVMVFSRFEFGKSSSVQSLQEREHGFVLDDNDSEDTYETEVFYDPVYSTPVFKNTSSKTSCPYDGGTLIDNPILTVDNPNATVTNGIIDGKAFFNFSIKNGTEVNGNSPNSIRSYSLDIVNGSNPHSAFVNPGGDGVFPVKFTDMARGETRERSITVEMSDPNIFSIEGLKFILYPECDGDASNVSTTLSVSAFFGSSCSDITLNAPASNWIVNESNNDNLSIHVTDYNKALTSNVIVQITPVGLNSWDTIGVIPSVALNNNASQGTFFDWNIPEEYEGDYDIRLRLNCNSGSIYTPRVNGTIDRKKANVFGLPSPIDDDYDRLNEDEISVVMTEDINCNSATVYLKDLETMDTLAVNVSCAGNYIEVVPVDFLDQRAPSVYRVTIQGLRDVHGNLSEDVNWVFKVGDYVYDPDCSPVMISNNNENQDAISQSIYRSTEITTDGRVNDGSTIGFKAQESISFEPGFEVAEDGALEASIETCND